VLCQMRIKSPNSGHETRHSMLCVCIQLTRVIFVYNEVIINDLVYVLIYLLALRNAKACLHCWDEGIFTLTRHALVNSFTVCWCMNRGMVDESGDQFVAYFLPTEETLEKRRRDVEGEVDYEDGDEWVVMVTVYILHSQSITHFLFIYY